MYAVSITKMASSNPTESYSHNGYLYRVLRLSKKEQDIVLGRNDIDLDLAAGLSKLSVDTKYESYQAVQFQLTSVSLVRATWMAENSQLYKNGDTVRIARIKTRNLRVIDLDNSDEIFQECLIMGPIPYGNIEHVYDLSIREASYCQYQYLYRVLREDEHPETNGITAQDPEAGLSVQDHVSKKKCRTQYISTSATHEKSMGFARKSKEYKAGKTVRIARIEVLDNRSLRFIDLTKDDVRKNHLTQKPARDFARGHEEVLVIGQITAECIVDIHGFDSSNDPAQ